MENLKNTKWQPLITKENLKLRAQIITKIRQFFAERNVLEVDTPLLCLTTATDPYIASIKVGADRYLQTSPEFAMKRLLAAGSGPIYQICKAFRQEEIGRYHNPEFTMLEWYRPGFDHLELMNEMDELLQTILSTKSAVRCSYQQIFENYFAINPHTASLHELQAVVKKNDIKATVLEPDNCDTWLQLLFTHLIEPQLGKNVPIFIYDFPVTQAALAKIRTGSPAVAERFEVYYQGIELANGYHELTDANEQRKRFLADQQKRQQLGYENVPIDEKLLAALDESFPECAGVALGVDRLVILACKAKAINEVISFNWDLV